MTISILKEVNTQCSNEYSLLWEQRRLLTQEVVREKVKSVQVMLEFRIQEKLGTYQVNNREQETFRQRELSVLSHEKSFTRVSGNTAEYG